MKKFPIFILIFTTVVLSGCLKKTGDSDTGDIKSKPFSGSLKAAIALGVPMKCSYKIGEMEYEGYVKGKNWRGKVESGDGRQGEVIIKGDCMWSWSDNEKQGMKMCFEPTEGDDKSIWDEPEGATAPDIDYNCFPAVISDAKFNPPSDINFLNLDDLDNMINTMPSSEEFEGFGQ